MSTPEPLSPSQFQLVVAAGDLRDQVATFGPWGVRHAAAERYGYRDHQPFPRLLKLLVDEGYLSYEAAFPGSPPDPAEAAAREN